MTALDVIRASNQWDEPWSYAAVAYFCRRYPWTIAFMILFIAMSIGFFRVEKIQEEGAQERRDRTAEQLLRDKQFCTAIPDVAEASAQALVNVLVAERIARGEPESEIQRIKDLGVLYIEEGRRLALSTLPSCPEILDTTPP